MNNISNKCKKKFQNASLGAVFLFGLFFVFPFLLIILVVLFFNKKLSLPGIYKILGIEDCLSEMNKNLKRKVDERIENDYKSNTPKQKTNYLEKMNDIIKNRSEELSRREELEKEEELEDYTEVLEDIKIDKTNENNKVLSNNYSKNSGNKYSSKYNSFNKGKSIWDDYESVIDIMKKNK